MGKQGSTEIIRHFGGVSTAYVNKRTLRNLLKSIQAKQIAFHYTSPFALFLL